jgi:hypothetical protein
MRAESADTPQALRPACEPTDASVEHLLSVAAAVKDSVPFDATFMLFGRFLNLRGAWKQRLQFSFPPWDALLTCLILRPPNNVFRTRALWHLWSLACRAAFSLLMPLMVKQVGCISFPRHGLQHWPDCLMAPVLAENISKVWISQE